MKNALLAVLITTVCHDYALAQQITQQVIHQPAGTTGGTITGAYSHQANSNNKVTPAANAGEAVITGRLTDGTISTDKLAHDILSTNKLTDGVVTSNKLADDIINSLKTIEDAGSAGKLSAGMLPEAVPSNGVAADLPVECGMQQLHKPRPINSRKRTGRLQI